MNQVRPFRASDVDAVIDLHQMTFTRRGKPGSGFRILPRTTANSCSRIRGATSTAHPSSSRRMDVFSRFLASRRDRLRSEGDRRAAIATNFMSEPGSARAGIGAATIVRKLLDGPQDLSLCDGTSEVRAMWEPLGAITTSITGLRWRLPLHPTLLVARQLRRVERRDVWRPGRFTSAVADVVDPLVAPIGRASLSTRPGRHHDAVAQHRRARGGHQ